MIRYLNVAAIILIFSFSEVDAQGNYGFRLIGRAVPGEATAAFAVDNLCYLGAGNCLQVIDVSSPSTPLLLGQLALKNDIEDIFVRDDMVFIADGGGGFVLADISSPQQIEALGEISFSDEAIGVCVSGNYAYVAALGAGLVIVDISTPRNPVQVGSFIVDWAALNVDVRDNLACVASGYGGLYIFDISDPASPVQLGLVDEQDIWAYDVKIDGDYAYMGYSQSGGGGGLRVVNIANPTVPVVIADLGFSDSIRRIDFKNGYVFAAASDAGMFIVNVNNPQSPAVIGGWQHGYGKNIAYENSRVFLAGGAEGLRIFNASNLYFPQLVSTSPTWSASQDVAVSGHYAYIVEQPSGLKVIDISNPEAPTVTFSAQFYLEGNEYRGVSSGVSVVGGRLYVSDFADMEGGRHDFRVYGLDNPASPESLGIYRDLYVGVRGHRVNNDVAYLSNSGDLKMLDVRNPGNMELITTFGGGWDFAYGMDISGNYLYVGTMETGLRILDISNDGWPVTKGSFDTDGQAFTAKYYDGYVYIPDYEAGLRIIDAHDPTSPFEVGHFDSYANCVDVAFIERGHEAFAIALFDDQIAALDIRDPANPIEVGYYETGDPRRVSVAGDTVYVADRNNGIFIFTLDAQVPVVDDPDGDRPDKPLLAKNYPNPFNPSTIIEFHVFSNGHAFVEIFDLLGRKVAEPLDGYVDSGIIKIAWDGLDFSKHQVAPGVFFYKVTAENKSCTGKMVFLK